jgi:hypothetical protein
VIANDGDESAGRLGDPAVSSPAAPADICVVVEILKESKRAWLRKFDPYSDPQYIPIHPESINCL